VFSAARRRRQRRGVSLTLKLRRLRRLTGPPPPPPRRGRRSIRVDQFITAFRVIRRSLWTPGRAGPAACHSVAAFYLPPLTVSAALRSPSSAIPATRPPPLLSPPLPLSSCLLPLRSIECVTKVPPTSFPGAVTLLGTTIVGHSGSLNLSFKLDRE